VAKGGHNIDSDVIRKRWKESLDNLPKAAAIADQTIVRDNSQSQYVDYLKVKDGKIQQLNENPPKWIKNAEQEISKELEIKRESQEMLHAKTELKALEPRVAINAEEALSGSKPGMLEQIGLADARIAAKPGFQTFAKGTGAIGAGLMIYDAATTTQHYNALAAQGNQFGADALLHDYVGRTGGGLAGGFAAGAVYGAATGSWTGPGALVTGAVGGAIGAFGGEAIARAYTKYEMNHQVGDDGKIYAHTNGHWEQSNWIHKNQPAPPDQIATLEYKRVSAITELALAHPQSLDTRNITLTDAQGQKTDYSLTKEGWVTQVVDNVPFAFDSIQPGMHDERADPDTSKQLDKISAARRDANTHYSENLAKGYLTDYVGGGVARDDRPIPEAVTQALKLPSEIHVKDPVTGNVWERSPKGEFTRTQYSDVPGPEGPVPQAEVLTARGGELARLGQEHQAHVQANRQYGAALVEQKYQDMQQQHQTTAQPGPAHEPQSVHNAHELNSGQHDPHAAQIAALQAEIDHHMQVAELKDQIAKMEGHLAHPASHAGNSLQGQVEPGIHPTHATAVADQQVPQHASTVQNPQAAQPEQQPARGRSR
jgi:hypothetical protein